MAEYRFTDEDIWILKQVVGDYVSRSGRTPPPKARDSRIIHAKTSGEIEAESSGSVVLYLVSDQKGGEQPGDTVTAYNRGGKLKSGTWVYVTPVGHGWEILTGAKAGDDDNDDSIPLKSGFSANVQGFPDTGTVTFIAEISETGGPTGYTEFPINITGDSAGTFIDAIHDGLQLTAEQKDRVVLCIPRGAKLKYNTFCVVSSYASFSLAISAADITPVAGGWPYNVRVWRSLVADVVDEDGDGT